MQVPGGNPLSSQGNVFLEELELPIVDELSLGDELSGSQPPEHGMNGGTHPMVGQYFQSQGQHTSRPSGVVVFGQKLGSPPHTAEELELPVELLLLEPVEDDPSEELELGHSDVFMGPYVTKEHVELSHMVNVCPLICGGQLSQYVYVT